MSYSAYGSILLCIDEYDNKNPMGRIYSPESAEGVGFSSTMEFLLYMISLFEKTKAPQSFSSIRSFKASEERKVPLRLFDVGKHGALGTFSIKILFRQNSSWQGSVVWQEGKQEESFRSVLELLMLIDSALSAGDR